MSYSTVVLGGVTLTVVKIVPRKESLSDKQVNGKTLTETKIVGRGAQQNRLVLSGLITGATASILDSSRTTLEALDDMSTHVYTDGKYNGTYYVIPGSIEFDDNAAEIHSVYRYNLQ